MNLGLFHEILSTQSVSGKTKLMSNVIKRRAHEMGCHVFQDHGNVYVVKGEAEVYPTFVAHTDTVHDIVPQRQFRVHHRKGLYFAWDPIEDRMRGVGGDDKVGIFVALSAVAALPYAKAAFFRDEETGCQGSKLALMRFFDDSAFVLQCDRNGYGDFVDEIMGTELFGDEFHDAVKPVLKAHGFTRHGGAFTDVYQLKQKGLAVAAANMSCGYYNAHTRSEHIYRDQVESVLSMVLGIAKDHGHKQWRHKARDRWVQHGWLDDHSSYGWYGDRDYDTWKKEWAKKADAALTSTSATPTVAGILAAEAQSTTTTVIDDLPTQAELNRLIAEQEADMRRDQLDDREVALMSFCSFCERDHELYLDDTTDLWFCKEFRQYVPNQELVAS